MTTEELATMIAERCHTRTSRLRPPTERDWLALEDAFGCKFPPLFYELHRLYSLFDVTGGWLPIASDIDPISPDTPPLVARFERESGRAWNDWLVPIYELGNGDYVCLRADEGESSRVFFADHEVDDVAVLKNSFAEFLADPEWLPSGA